MLLSVVKAAQLIIALKKLCKVMILTPAITDLQHKIGSQVHYHLGICMSFTAHTWYGGHFISACRVWRVRAEIQVSKKEFYTRIHLN